MKKERLEQLRAHVDEGGHLGRPIVIELLREVERFHQKMYDECEQIRIDCLDVD